MRVTQIADLAGTTPRAVRHYHRLGLLSVPPTVRGGREYAPPRRSGPDPLGQRSVRDAVEEPLEALE